MADLSDVTAYLAQTAANAAYPNGTTFGSIAGMDCRVYEGWPIPDQLDLDMTGYMMDNTQTPPVKVPRPGGPVANVSVFPMAGTGVTTYQLLDHTYLITPPAINLSLSVNGTTITVTGQPAAGEYITVVADDAYIFSQTGVTTSALLAALATQAQAQYPSTTSTNNTITIPVGHLMVVRQGGAAVQGKVTHRQRHCVMVTVWAPTSSVRNTLSSAVDVAIKNNIKVSMPDTSEAVVRYNRTMVSDLQTPEAIYRRDLIYEVEYATVFQFPAYVITSTTTSIINPVNQTATALAIT